MKYALGCAVFLLAACAAERPPPPFESRAASAKAAEAQPAVKEYLERHLFPAMRTHMSVPIHRCVGAPAASTADFTIVADITAGGSLANVTVRPATNTAMCFAEAFETLRLPPPPGAYSSGLPIVIEMELGDSNSVR